MTKIYVGHRDQTGIASVHVFEGKGRRLLDLRTDIDNHSPTGFEWGYAGSGPAQLALALLADALNNDGLALRLHQQYKWNTICKLQKAQWELVEADVRLTAAMLAVRFLTLHLLQVDDSVEGVCMDCGFFLLERGLVRKTHDGIFAIADGYDLLAIRHAADAHHALEETQ